MEGEGKRPSPNSLTLTLTRGEFFTLNIRGWWNETPNSIFFRFWFRIRLVSEILFFTLYCNKRYGVAFHVVVSREKYVSYWVSYCLVTVL